MSAGMRENPEVQIGFAGGVMDKLNDPNKPYLGDPTAIGDMLKTEAALCFEALAKPDYEKVLHEAGHRIADALLGKDAKWHTIRGWNEPGVVDEFVMKWCGAGGPTPEDRISHAFIMLISDLLDIIKYSQEPGIPDELWKPQIDDAFTDLALIMVGVSPVTTATM